MKILITGCAGFIGSHLTWELQKNHDVIGIDNLNCYYDVNLKEDRLNISKSKDNFKFYNIDITDSFRMNDLFEKNNIDVVINLAAQAGVEYSLKNPEAYIDTNIYGFLQVLECCRKYNIKHLIYASSSSVYGNQTHQKLSEHCFTDDPYNVYAVTKKTNELMAESYRNLYELNSTGLRFFTVFGPWGRPDMSIIIFIKTILQNKPIKLFGNNSRSFTYIDNVISCITTILGQRSCKSKIYNIGNERSTNLENVIKKIENITEKTAIIEECPRNFFDVIDSKAHMFNYMNDFGYIIHRDIDDQLKKTIEWVREYYKL